ncbi:alpha/beta hydrolase family protein [Streptomyces sp. BI20]|uniref:alpha/beta hydrolase family protein n=1 Tax=Streptomyces sp. BI20 TaxID=3403460 RepID=UPI003C72C912
MTDPAAERDAAEEASAFSHPAVPPDATASYGDHPDQVVDFYAPRDEGTGPVPLVVLVHGGAWRAPYDRVHVSPLADHLARRGFAVASVEYRRGPERSAAGPLPHPAAPAGTPLAGRWPATLDDVAAAFDVLPALARAALPRADPARTVITGHSAGGQLALWAAARHLLPADAPWWLSAPPALRGVVALAPIADLRLAEELDVCGGASGQFLGGPAHFADRLPYADPASLLPTGIATTIVHGRADLVVPAEVTEGYVAAAAFAGEPIGLTLLDEVGHFPLIDPAADACAVVAEEIAQLAW